MGDFKVTKKALNLMRRQAQNRLHTVVQMGVVPYFQDNVRVDTGRLRASVRADYPVYNQATQEVEAEILIGGITVDGRLVDYAEDLYTTPPADGELEDIADNLKDELGYYVTF